MLGSGDGVVKGSSIAGTVHWSIFEVVGEVCETNITGVVTADNRARIQFDTRGFGTVPNEKRPERWNMPAARKFVTDAEEYSWLNRTLALWMGTFDMKKRKHHYEVYLAEG